MNKFTKIIVCYHKEANIFGNDCLLPIHVGRFENPDILSDLQGDNTGENISLKHPNYCELTGLYWLWKNVDADHYGLFHYRRFLDIPNKYGRQTHPSALNLDDYSNEKVNKMMEKYDIILPKKTNFKTSVYEHYKKSHIIKDLDLIIEIIKRDYPEYALVTEKVLKSKHGYFCNMFVMKKDIFNEYCEWLFDVLKKAEKNIDPSEYDPSQKRVLGFLAERMLAIFIQYKKNTTPNLKIKEVRRMFINAEPIKNINFLIGNYTQYTDKIYLSIFNIKFQFKIN